MFKVCYNNIICKFALKKKYAQWMEIVVSSRVEKHSDAVWGHQIPASMIWFQVLLGRIAASVLTGSGLK